MEKQPKYMLVVQWAREQISRKLLLPGSRFPSEKELGEQFGLSRQTVRHALDILENEGIVSRVRGSGTFVAETGVAKPSAQSMTIGIISTYLDDYIFPGIIRGIEQVLTKHGYGMQFAFTHNRIANEIRALQAMLDKQVDGLIVEPTKSGLPSVNLDLYRQIQTQRTPLVFFNARLPSLPIPQVSLNDEQAGLIATRYLISKGHRRIAGFFLLNDLQGHLRYFGYVKALAEAGIPIRDEDVLWYTTEDIPHLSQNRESLCARLQDADALFCYNDQIAIQLVDMLRQSGKRVPEDISIISVDNCDLAALCDPPLTTIAHPMQQLGEKAAETLLSMISGNVGATTLFPPRLIERGSVLHRPGR